MPAVAVRAWTLGTPGHYDRAVRTPGNAKAPGGYAFETREDAEAYLREHGELPYRPYEIELPGLFSDCTTVDSWEASVARHKWHEATVPIMAGCCICVPARLVAEISDCPLLLVEAPFINPDTGEVARVLTP